MTTTSDGRVDALGAAPANDARATIEAGAPYVVDVTIKGTAPILFHRWSCEDVAAKAKAPKSSTAKRTDNVDTFVYRCDDGTIGLPGEYLRQAIITAAKRRQDPASPRKSAMDLYKAAVVSLTEVASLGAPTWDYLDQRRVTVQRNGITRVRPAFHAGWTCSVLLQVLLPEYIGPSDLHSVISDAGRLVGVGDFRPTYGRFQVVSYIETSEPVSA